MKLVSLYEYFSGLRPFVFCTDLERGRNNSNNWEKCQLYVLIFEKQDVLKDKSVVVMINADLISFHDISF